MNNKAARKPTLRPYAFAPYDSSTAPKRLQRSHHPSAVKLLTIGILQTYRSCNPSFRYLTSANPRRVITKPSQGVSNNNYDNVNSDLIFYVNDVLGLQQKNKYLVLDLLGQGTFGQVVKCKKLDTGELVAVKAVKNRPAYFNQGMFEVHILELLNARYDPDQHNIVQLKDYFIDRQHLCLVFELLSVNMFDLIKQNHYRGLSTNLIRVFLRQILKTLRALQECGIVHCDLKPENILLRNQTSPQIKLIDFGSACYENQTVYTYIQSRFYRSPEVIIGYPYTSAIDMWSLGCIAAELFLGLPLFPGHNEYNQLIRIIEMQGELPEHLLKQGKFAANFYAKVPTEGGGYTLQPKSEEQYCREQNVEIKPFKRYFHATKLVDIIQNYRYKKNLSEEALQKERRTRVAFVHFLSGLLKLDPSERWSAEQASCHPFITGEPFIGSFTPPPRTTRDLPSAPEHGGRTWGGHSTGGAVPIPSTLSTPPPQPLISAERPPAMHIPMHPVLPLAHQVEQVSGRSSLLSHLHPDYSPGSSSQKGRRSRSISVDTKRTTKQQHHYQQEQQLKHTAETRLGASAGGGGRGKAQKSHPPHPPPHHGHPPQGKNPSHPQDKRGRGQGKPPPQQLAPPPSHGQQHRRSRSNEHSLNDSPPPASTARMPPPNKHITNNNNNNTHSHHVSQNDGPPDAEGSANGPNATIFSISNAATSALNSGGGPRSQQHQHAPRSPRQSGQSLASSMLSVPGQQNDKQPEKYSPRLGHRGKDQHSPRKSPRRSGYHKSSPPDALAYRGDELPHDVKAGIGKHPKHPAPKSSHRNGSPNNKGGPVFSRGRQTLARKPPDKSSTWPGPAPPIHQLPSPASPPEAGSASASPAEELDSSPARIPQQPPPPPVPSVDGWDPTYSEDTLLFYDGPPFSSPPSASPSSVPSTPPSTHSPPTQSKTSPRTSGMGRGRGHLVGGSQPISIKQSNQRRPEGGSYGPSRWGSATQSFSEWSEPLMPVMDASPSSYGGGRWQEEDGARASDLVFGVSPTSLGPGFYGGMGRGHAASSPHGGVGELLTPPRFHFVPPPAHWGYNVYNQQQHQQTTHHTSNRQRHESTQRLADGEIPALAQRFAASSIDSIDAHPATDNSVVND